MLISVFSLRHDLHHQAASTHNKSAPSSGYGLGTLCISQPDLLALRYLMEHVTDPLTVEMLLHAHSILLKGAVSSNGTAVPAGVIRAGPAYAGNHVYPEGGPQLAEQLQTILNAFNAVPADTEEAFIAAPVRLFYDTITLHPFVNGNGRMCRTLLSVAMMKAGMPFPVALSSGHKKARGHYMRAIFRARRGNMKELNTMALMSADYVMCNYTENRRVAHE